MHYLIDGYNLTHAVGLISRRAGPKGLHSARNRFLDMLREASDEAVPPFTVVFDAAGARPAGGAQQEYRGIRVLYAVHHPQADDLIEEMLAACRQPDRLTLVSNDRRLQDAARRCHCPVLSSDEFLTFLERAPRQPSPEMRPQAEKPDTLAPSEIEEWLQSFADPTTEARLRKLSDPPEFWQI